MSVHANADAGDEHGELQEESENRKEDDLEHSHRGAARKETHAKMYKAKSRQVRYKSTDTIHTE